VDPRGAFSPPPPQPQQPGMYGMPQQVPPPGMYAPGGPPPGMFPPPPMMMMPPPGFGAPPPRRGGAGKTVLLVLVLILLAVSVLANVLLVGGAAMGGNSTLRQTVAEGSQSEKIAVVPIAGIIESNLARQVEHFLDQAEKDGDVKAIVVEIDSPGGTVTASDEIYARLMRFKQNKKVPVIVSMGSLATSGGYYAACAGDHIFAQQTTLTGNIGVLMPRFNFAKLMDKWGIEENTIVSEGAKFKNAGSNFSPDKPEDTKYLQGIADSMFTRFKDVVKTGRSAQLKSVNLKIEQVADGRAFTANEAKSMGLVDSIGYLGDAIAHAKTAAGLSNPHVFRYSNPPTLLDLFGANSSVAPSRANGGMTVNGVNINVDRKLLDELAAPRVLYLWRGQ
jgi:protease-4